MKSAKPTLSAFQLKLIAFISMVIDHTAVAIPVFRTPQTQSLYSIMRGIGRLAFPLFCFFIAEGAVKTGNRRKYLLRLGIMALLCEIPFDLMAYGAFPTWRSQNTIWTLSLGLLGITLFEFCRQRWPKGFLSLLAPGALALCLVSARYLRTDYGMAGVLLIYGFYIWRTEMSQVKAYPAFLMLMMGTLWVNNHIQLLSLLAFLLIFLYNDNLGKKVPKYAFYAGYFGHLLILALLRAILS